MSDCHVHQQFMWRMLEKQNKTDYVIGILVDWNDANEDHMWQEMAGLSQPMGLLGKIRLFATEEDAAFYRLARMER
jgi:hypothetical protein